MNSRTIFLIEDNPSDIELAQRVFEKVSNSYSLVVLEDGQEALDYLAGQGRYAGLDIVQTPSLILLDLKLPGMDGLEVLARIRAIPLTRHIPVVIFTSSNEERDIRAGYDLGANSYIRKPVDFIKFGEVIQNLCQYWLVINQTPPRA